jgi:hypothetical protein
MKAWVLSSDAEKWKDFKCYLKSKHFDDELTMSQNIAKGCKGRIPPTQWADLVEIWYTEKFQVWHRQNFVALN